MPLIRLISLLVVLGGITLLLAQNWLPVLPLVFLGMSSQALPLAVWILISLAAGAFTSLSITGLFKISNYSSRSPSLRRNSGTTGTQYSKTATSQSQSNTAAVDDWGSDTDDGDWNFDNKTQSNQNTVKDTASEPSTANTGVYSYNYQQPGNSGVGVESVYDADYRIITPPEQEKTKTQDNDDDWGFEDDDDFKDEPSSRR